MTANWSSRLGLTTTIGVVGVIALMVIPGLASASTVLNSWSSPWNGSGPNKDPCNGPSNAIFIESSSATTGDYTGYSQSTAISSSSCKTNTADYTQWAGLYATQTFSVSSTASNYRVTASMTMNYYWSVSSPCTSGFSARAKLLVYIAIWDFSQETNVYGNVYVPVVHAYSLDFACVNGNASGSGTVSNPSWTHTWTGITLQGGDTLQVRLGVQEETQVAADYKSGGSVGYSSSALVEFGGTYGPITLNSITVP